MSLAAYKVLHILGILLTVVGLGAVCLHYANGGNRESNQNHGLVNALHGVGLLIILVSGFGMLARLGLNSGFPLWIWIKLGLWVVVGACAMVPKRSPQLTKPLLLILPLLGTLGGYLAIYKPFSG